MSLSPYYSADGVTLYLGDAREVLGSLPEQPVSCVLDPPYGETSAPWDRWQEGLIAAVADALPGDAGLWCFGSQRMFLKHVGDFTSAGWKFAQDAHVLWEKANVSGPAKRDRLARVHELALHWYRGRWGALHHEWDRQRSGTDDRSVARKRTGCIHHNGHGAYGDTAYIDDGTRHPRSVAYRVIQSPSVRHRGRHQDEKPLAVVTPLVQECTPPGGLVLDATAGVCTTGLAALMVGRRAVLIEADEAICEIGAERLEAHRQAPDLLGLAFDEAEVMA